MMAAAAAAADTADGCWWCEGDMDVDVRERLALPRVREAAAEVACSIVWARRRGRRGQQACARMYA